MMSSAPSSQDVKYFPGDMYLRSLNKDGVQGCEQSLVKTENYNVSKQDVAQGSSDIPSALDEGRSVKIKAEPGEFFNWHTYAPDDVRLLHFDYKAENDWCASTMYSTSTDQEHQESSNSSYYMNLPMSRLEANHSLPHNNISSDDGVDGRKPCDPEHADGPVKVKLEPVEISDWFTTATDEAAPHSGYRSETDQSITVSHTSTRQPLQAMNSPSSERERKYSLHGDETGSKDLNQTKVFGQRVSQQESTEEELFGQPTTQQDNTTKIFGIQSMGCVRGEGSDMQLDDDEERRRCYIDGSVSLETESVEVIKQHRIASDETAFQSDQRKCVSQCIGSGSDITTHKGDQVTSGFKVLEGVPVCDRAVVVLRKLSETDLKLWKCELPTTKLPSRRSRQRLAFKDALRSVSNKEVMDASDEDYGGAEREPLPSDSEWTANNHDQNESTSLNYQLLKKIFEREETFFRNIKKGEAANDGVKIVMFEPTPCVICGTIFKTLEKIQEHLSCNHATTLEQPYMCMQCGVVFSRLGEIRVHVQDKHSSNSVCQICGQKNKTEKGVIDHIRVNHFPKLSCLTCGDKFSHPQDIRQHIIEQNHKSKIMCEICYFVARSAALLRKHKKRCQEKRLRPQDGMNFAESEKYMLESKLLERERSFIENIKLAEKLKENDVSRKVKSDIPLTDCVLCGFVYWDLKKLTEHITSTHLTTLEQPYRCEQCDGLFPSMEILDKHVQERHPCETWCKLCGRNLGVEQTTEFAHLRESHVGHYTCVTCGDQFHSFSDVSRHVNESSHRAQDMCESCGFIARSSEQLFMHQKKIIHPENEGKINYRCTLCEFSALKVLTLQQHYLTHPGVKANVCMYCSKTFASQTVLQLHIRRFHGELKLVCNICGATMHNQILYKHHLELRHSKKNHVCQICGKTFAVKPYLLRHIRNKHQKDKHRYVCHICGKRQMTLDTYKAHMATHDEGSYKCKRCRRRFTTAEDLQSHQAAKHKTAATAPKHEPCDVCGKYVKSRYTHMVKHRDEANFKCNICDKIFKRKGNLKSHLRSHSEERKYACDICGDAFKWKHNMESHRKSHASGYYKNSRSKNQKENR